MVTRVEWIYGRNVAEMALKPGARRRVHRIVATPPALRALGGAVPSDLSTSLASRVELDALCGSPDHQGIALAVDPFPYAAADDLLGSDLLVVLDEVSDPRNLGAVARSALAAGAGGLVIPKHRTALVTAAAVKASAGAVEHLPVAQVTNIAGFLKQAKAAGAWVYGASGEAFTSYRDVDYAERSVLVFGAEGRGLRPLVARTCDLLASVPLRSPVESLNVSVAAALFLFEVRRPRPESGGAAAGTVRR